jgi:transcriptional regulator with XRE-family HTH domain
VVIAGRPVPLEGPQRGSQGRQQGPIGGYVLKVIRESLGLTQQGLAFRLEVAVDTLRAWETGRRPLGTVRACELIRMRHQFAELGAAAELLAALDAAVEADWMLDCVMSGGELRPSGRLVRPLVAQMLAWPLTGRPPAEVVDVRCGPRRGPVPSRPVVAGERRRWLSMALASLPQGAYR